MQLPKKLTPEEALDYLNKLKHEQDNYDGMMPDNEGIHILADDVLCSVLRFYGQDDVANAFHALEKWYA